MMRSIPVRLAPLHIATPQPTAIDASSSMDYNTPMTLPAVIIVDHGSKVPESNHALVDIARQFQSESVYDIVEPAHMELAAPTIADAFARCVTRGGTEIIIFPFFLLPGRHVTEDIPRLVKQAAQSHPGITWQITDPIAPHPLVNQIIQSRIDHPA